MSARSASGTASPVPEFRHEALLYSGGPGFLAGTVPFIEEGVAGGEAVLVVVSAAKIEALRAALGAGADKVTFADMASVGRNPARIIPRWRQFVDDHLPAGRPIRGIGEPIYVERSAAELVECHTHEALLNVAFAGGPGWTLLCPYDVEALDPAVLAEARRNHPYLVSEGATRPSGDYHASPPPPARADQPLPPPPADVEALAFDRAKGALRAVRDAASAHARRAGADGPTAAKFALAASELATNSLCHGGGRGTVRLWTDGGVLVCEVRDAGHFDGPPLLGRQLPDPGQLGGRGLWLVNQLCDLLQIRDTPDGTTVRLYLRLTPGTAAD
jgi:anti-sigma regulatory factor (Ser/Thr protein kinase)